MIKQIFDEIAAEGGSNAKMAILAKYKDNELLKRVLYMANSKRVKFYIKQIPEYSQAILVQELSKNLDALSLLSNRVLTGGAAITHLASLLSLSSKDDAYIIERIIEKDCKIGLGTTYINKVFPKLIEDTPYMGAKSFDEKLVRKLFENGGRALSQVKMDGRYCNAIIRSGEVELESRQGEPTIVTGAKFLEELSTVPDCVLNGELTMNGVSRYESNGIIASIIDITGKVNERTPDETNKKVTAFESKHGSFTEALNSIVFTIWDRITVDEYFEAKSNRPYNMRFDTVIELVTYIPKPFTNVNFVETFEVSSYVEALEHFKEVLNRGEEGTILKAADGKWKDGKPNWQVKFKLEMDVDLKIVGFNYGTGKNANVISSLKAESSDGKVVTQPQGITEEMMQYITDNQSNLLNTILECTCSGLSKDREGNYSLLYPRLKRLRDDKNTCDTLESIIGIEHMAKGLPVA